MSEAARRGPIAVIQAYSIPLLAGVAAALLAANLAPDAYHRAVHWRPFGDAALFGHPLDLHYLANDLFMTLFFAIAAVEITRSCLPGGDLNPPAKAMNPLIGTLGGVLGPVAAFFAGLGLSYAVGVYGPTSDFAALAHGWGVPTATDIALAWLVARTVFGRGHPAIQYLLLLAVVDDGIGLAIIAIFYGDPAHPVQPEFLALVALGMAIAFALRRLGASSWRPYVAIAGPLAWSGLAAARLHPALALVFIVPFLPAVSAEGEPPLLRFEHQLKLPVDLGLFFFAFSQAGVTLADVGPLTWLVLGSLVVGKTGGIAFFGWLATRLGFPLPGRMTWRDLWLAGYIAALGLTVALFVASAAFVDPVLLGQAKMGALLSGAVGLTAAAIVRPRSPIHREE
jgi:NhaA family Na+:H+ antiporter